MAIPWNSYVALTHDKSVDPRVFDIVATYRSPGVDNPITDTFHIDLLDYWNTRIERTDLEQHGQKLEEVLTKAVAELKQLGACVERLSSIAQPTGLALSITTLRNLQTVMTGGMLPAEQIDAKSCPEDVFGEVLGVTPDVALAM